MKNKFYYLPSVPTTKYFVQVGGKAKVKIELLRDGSYFYRLENEKRVPVGDFRELMNWLHRVGGEWLTKRKQKFVPAKMFFNRSEAMFLLKQGCPLLSMDMDIILVFTEDYEKILCSDGKSLEYRDLPPGDYCLAFCEPKLPMTYREVQVEKSAQAKEEERKKAAERKRLERDRAAVIEAERKIKRQDSARQEPASPPLVQKDEDFSFWQELGIGAAVSLVLAGLGFGYVKYKSSKAS